MTSILVVCSFRQAHILVAVILLLCSVDLRAADARRITTGSNVRLRSAPDTTASIVTEMPVGTELSVLDQATSIEAWFHVRNDEGQEGWVVGRLTTSIDAEHYDDTIQAIVGAQLKDHSEITGTSFAARVQLLNLIERTSRRISEPEASARFALYRLRSMRDTFDGIPFGGNERDPYRGWLMEHWDAGFYNEPAGAWIVDPKHVLKIHEQYRGTNTADDIAWFYVANGFPGECEGYVPCSFGWKDGLEGEYLRLHPDGRHRDEALTSIAKFLDALGSAHDRDDLACPSLREPLRSLASAIMASSSGGKPSAVIALKRIAELSALCP